MKKDKMSMDKKRKRVVEINVIVKPFSLLRGSGGYSPCKSFL